MKPIHIALAGLAMLLLAGLASCKSKQNTTHGSSEPATAAETSRTSSPLAPLAASYGAWSDVKVPVKVEIAKPKKFSMSGTATMVYGSALNVSFKMLGFEVASAYADADSVIINVKAMGMYYAESLRKFTSAFGLDIADLQSLLFGRAFVPGSGQLSAAQSSKFSVSPISGSEYMLVPDMKIKNVEWFYTAILGEEPFVNGLAVEASGHNPILCNFASPYASEAGTVAQNIKVRTTIRKHDIEAGLTWSMGKASWDKGAKANKPSLPRNAKRMTTDQVLKMLKGL